MSAPAAASLLVATPSPRRAGRGCAQQRRRSTGGVLTPPLSPRNANYTIDARLDPATRTITGSEIITWRNITASPAADLQFHLYWNAWRDTRSTFMREQALGGSRDDAAGAPTSGRASTSPSITSSTAPIATGLEAFHRARR